MTYNLKDFERIYRFRPSLTLDEGRHIFRHEFLIRKIQDDKAYSMTKEITDLIIPEKPTEHDLIWKGLYMPFRRNGKIVLVPFVIHSYKEIFYSPPQLKLDGDKTGKFSGRRLPEDHTVRCA